MSTSITRLIRSLYLLPSPHILLAALCWALSLGGWVLAWYLALFGAPLPVFAILYGWLFTVGLPTTLAIALVVSLSEGGQVDLVIGVATGLALIFQIFSFWILRLAFTSRKGKRP